MKALFLAVIASASSPLMARDTIPPPPAFPRAAVTDTIHGVAVADPYRALEDGTDPQVRRWSDAQNKRTRGYLDTVPNRAAVADKVKRLFQETSPSYSQLQSQGDRLFALYADPQAQQPVIVVLNQAADPASRRTVLDPNAIDASGHTAIDWFVPSSDGRRLAVSLSRNGSEDGTLHIYDVASGNQIGDSIAHVQYPTGGGGVAWTADCEGFWYTRYPGDAAPEADRHFNLSVYFHRVGTPAVDDPLVLSSKDGLPRIAEIWLDNRAGGEAALALVELGDGGQWQQFVLRRDRPALRVAGYEDRIIAGVIARDGTLYGLSRRDAPMGKIVKLRAPYIGGFAAATTIVPERKDTAVIDGGPLGTPLTVAGNRLFVSRIAGGPSQVDIHDLEGRYLSSLPLPPVASVGEIDPLANGDALYLVATYLQPPYFERWSAATGTVGHTALAVTSSLSFADTELKRVFATSKDGTRVPITVIARKGIRLDGGNPALIYGYGGYGVNMKPRFLGPALRLWLDAGGAYAVANIRGGGEYGDAWHREGMLTHKQNGFDDFAAAARSLVDLGYTSQDRLALEGESNGGMLMGAMLTQHPGLARAVVSSVGTYDAVRMELDPNGVFNVTEFGSVRDPDQFKALYGYSPYHHVRAGTRYPAVLLMTGANDGRVNPLHSRKFAAALQAAQASDRPILLRTSDTSGHGIGSSTDDQLFVQTDRLTFLFDQLGMELP